ncbi:MAG: SNF2-related protein [Limisphaerales bacterium]
MSVPLTEKLLAAAAGWEVVKHARSLVAADRVLSSAWEPPLLRGLVQAGGTAYRAGLAIRSAGDVENLCTCRESREWGTICPHSVAVGLHFLKPAVPAPAAVAARPPGPAPARPPRKDAAKLPRDPAGTPLEVAVIFPPDPAEAIARGKVTVWLEGRTGGGVTMLDALVRRGPFALSPADERVLEAVELIALGDTPGALQLDPTQLAALLPALAGHPRVMLGKRRPLLVTNEPWRPRLKATLSPSGEITLAMAPVTPPPVPVVGERLWLWAGDRVQPLALPPGVAAVLGGPLRLSRAQVPAFLSQTWPALDAGAEIEADFRLEDFELVPDPPRFHLQLAGGLAQLAGTLQAAYGPRIVTPGVTSKEDAAFMPDPQKTTRYRMRDFAAEAAALDTLLRAGFGGPDAQGRLQLVGQNPVIAFFARVFPRLEREWTVVLEERLDRSTKEKLERIEPRFQVTSSGEQWFDLAVSYTTPGGEVLATAEIQRLLRGGQNGVRLKNGKFALLDTGAVEELEEILVDAAPEQRGGAYRMGAAQAGFFMATAAGQPAWKVEAPAAWRGRVQRQAGEARLECPPLGALDAVLRDYQKQGVAWLRFLRENGFGGVLADEMGLGKTLQALALLSTIHDSPATTHRPHLVVCPTSLVFNWQAEAAKFTPHLRVVALHGPDRHVLLDRVREADLVITSYALIRRDAERYRGLEFDTVILDEAQHIKNRQTQNAQAVKAVRCRHRLVLTGTPLENSVLDLWSIFDFLMPGYLGAAQDFRDRYEAPIARARDPAVMARLGRRLRPFILRRTKRDVAKELPPKLEQVAWCELTPPQAAVYGQLLAATRHEVNQAVGAQGLAKSRMLVLTALLRLRQVCCDLRLLGTSEPDTAQLPARADPAAASGKLAHFTELLDEILDGGHRALVFSQFTSMLGLLREQLEAAGLSFCYLDGSTSDRGAVVQRFQNSPDIPVFLISLKAGGVGLNLTGADTVIHFDPWWNPAVEDQATDRAHRIGQSRTVTSYKLITRGTVEEKILALQQRKRELIAATLTGEDVFTAGLNWDEIQELLA